MRSCTIVLWAIEVLAAVSPATEAFDPAARAKAIAPFLDEQALLVAHVDLTRIDTDAIASKLLQYARASGVDEAHLADLEESIAPLKRMATEWLGQMARAGGKDLYVVHSLAYEPEGAILCVVPLGDGADAIVALLKRGVAETPATSPGGPTQPPGRPSRLFAAAEATVTLANAVCGGTAATLKQLEQIEAHARGDLPAAFAAAGDTVAQVLILPSADSRRVIEETMPQLPPFLGGGPSTALTRGVKWAALGIDTPPRLAVTLTVQSDDAAAAEALRKVIVELLGTIGRQEIVRRSLPEFDQAAAMLTPAVAQDQLRLRLSTGQIDKLATDILGPGLRRARGRAKRAASGANVHFIYTALQVYATNHNGQWPADWRTMVKLGMLPETLLNPMRPRQRPGYVYVRPDRPASELRDSGKIIVVYENYDKWGEGITVGFADGSATFVTDEGEFKKLLRNSTPAEPKR